MSERKAKCKTRGCRNRACEKGRAKGHGYCGGCYALRWAVGVLP